MPQNKLLHLTASGVGFLVIGLAIVSFKLYDFSVQNKRLKDKISLEKSIHQNQISEILNRYDSLKEYNEENTVALKATEQPVNKDLEIVKNHKILKKRNGKKAFKKLKAVNVSSRCVRIISNDVVETNVSSKIDQVRVRFTLEGNNDLSPGIKQITIQVVNPKNRLLALKGRTETQIVKEVYYDGLNTDACLFVDLYQYQLIVGEYKINLIHNGDIIGYTNFKVN